jgi:hypothetical protein
VRAGVVTGARCGANASAEAGNPVACRPCSIEPAGQPSARRLATRRVLREVVRPAVRALREDSLAFVIRHDRRDLPAYPGNRSSGCEQPDRPDVPTPRQPGHLPGLSAVQAGPRVLPRQPRNPHTTIVIPR